MTKYNLLSLKPERRTFSLVLFIGAFVAISLVLFKVKTFDSVLATGIVTCGEVCQVELTLSYDKTDALSNNPFISYNNEKYDIWNITYNEPYINGEMVYQDVKFETNLHSDKNLVNFKILSNRERIVDKVKRIIIER